MAKGDYTITLDMKRLQGIIAKSPQVTGQIIRQYAFEGERYVKQSFGTSPGGRRYGNHVASSAGYPPNVDTGKLRNSINVLKIGTFSYSINTGDTEYARELEFGKARMASRPFMLPMSVWLRQQMSGGAGWGDIVK